MDKQLSQMSFDESDSTPGLIDSDSEDLPPKIQDINNIIDTSTPRDSHKDRGDATGEDIIDLESDSIDGNEDSVSDTAANDPVDTFPDKGKEIKPPREWLSLEPRRVVNLFHPNGKSYLYDRAKMSLFNCEFSSVTREQGTCVVKWKYDEGSICECQWVKGPRGCKPVNTPEGDAEKLNEREEIGGKRGNNYSFHSVGGCVQHEPNEKMDTIAMEIERIQQAGQYKGRKIPRHAADATFPQLLEKVKDPSQMVMFIVGLKQELRRLQNGEPGYELQRKYPKDQEWRYSAVQHLRLAQIESTKLEDGSYAILPNDEGKYETSFFVEDPSDEAKPLENKRFLYERHRTNGSDYYGEVEPSHIY